MLMFFENRLVFIPTRASDDWQAAPSRFFQDVDLVCAKGTKLHGWWCPYADSGQAVLYLHGNAGNLSHRGPSVQKVRDLLKMNVLIVDYPGYGKSEGSPTEMGCYYAADAAYDWLIEQQKIEPERIILYGVSLGGAVAVDLASRKKHEVLVLIKTFTSVPDVGQYRYPWLPVRWLVRNRFNSLNKIEFCARPIFVAHSPDDELIPFALGKKLFDAANEPKDFFTLQGGHNESLPKEFFASLQAFLLRPEGRGL